MGDLSAHFDKREFACKCGKSHDFHIDSELIEKLETLHALTGATAIYITSGFRCPEWSKSVGGYFNDAHTKGIAADIVIDGKYNRLSSEAVAEAAERVGFSGIGIIDSTAVHVDVRNDKNYVNSHWFGDERTGNDNITTFQTGRKFDGENVSHETKLNGKHKITVIIDGATVYESEV